VTGSSSKVGSKTFNDFDDIVNEDLKRILDWAKENGQKLNPNIKP
jgi:hypothetical protein